MRIHTLLLFIGLLSGCSRTAPPVPSAPAAPPFKAVATVKELMLAMTTPSSNAVFAAQGEAPQDDAGWLNVQNNALVLAESGNLLMLGDRVRDRDAWIKDATALVDAATVALNAARAKDAAKFGEAADAVYQTCEGCHQQYLPK